jgi:hypothetical protein
MKFSYIFLADNPVSYTGEAASKLKLLHVWHATYPHTAEEPIMIGV